MGSSNKYIDKIFPKTDISYPLISTRTCAYQGVRIVSYTEHFACVLNEFEGECSPCYSERYLETLQTFLGEILAKTVNDFLLLSIFTKC